MEEHIARDHTRRRPAQASAKEHPIRMNLLLGSLLLPSLLTQATLGQTTCAVDNENACKAKCDKTVLNIEDVFHYPYVLAAQHV